MRLADFDIYEWNSQIQKAKKQISKYENNITSNGKILENLNAIFFDVSNMDVQKKKIDTKIIHKYKEITKELLEDRDKIWELTVNLEYMERVLNIHESVKKGLGWAWIGIILFCWTLFGLVTSFFTSNDTLVLIIGLLSPILPFIYGKWEENKDFSKMTKSQEKQKEAQLEDRDIPRIIKNIVKTEDDLPLESIRSILGYYNEEIGNLRYSYYIKKYSDLGYKGNNNYDNDYDDYDNDYDDYEDPL